MEEITIIYNLILILIVTTKTQSNLPANESQDPREFG